MTTNEPHRTHLPIPDPVHVGLTTFDAKDPDTVFPPIQEIRPPSGAPNVLIVLLDDVGFGASSAFGGPCATPVAERLAANGLSYSRFHTTALCSPTRQALLTGRNHHSVGMGGITEIATSAPGYSSVRPKATAPLPETLRLNGYSTAQFGKCHEVPTWHTSPMGPFDMWPTGSGFDHFYGFIGGEANQWFPTLYEGTTPVEPDKTPAEGYHLTEDLTNKAIGWVRQQRSLMSDKPFFMYFAPGATHAPHHVSPEWSDKYKGRFDGGWDALRVETFERQKASGVIPPDAELTPRQDEIPAWDDMPDELKPVLARQMEIYAGFLEHTDHNVGRLVDALDDLGVLEDTLIYYVIGDNGASAEGQINGTFNENFFFNGAADMETAEFLVDHIDDFGGPNSYNHYAVGWAFAMCSPYQWAKQVASHFGGTRNGTIVHWPNGFATRGEVRNQFHHVIDIAPTVLEAAGIPHPLFVHGIQQRPIEGVSMVYTFDDAQAAERHETQYFELGCNRGIYHKGWTAVTKHATPWISLASSIALDDDVWELYDTNVDWTQAHDLAAEQPARLAAMQRQFLIEATKYNVLPLDDRRVERLNSDTAGRPVLVKGTSQLLFGGMGRLTEHSVLNMKNKSHSITADIDVPDTGASGVLVAQGGQFGGWCVYLDDGVPAYCYNLYGAQRFKVKGTQTVSPGHHQVRVEFAYAGPGLGKGGEAVVFLDGAEVGRGHVDATQAFLFSYDETCDIGRDDATPVSDDYTSPESKFTGTINWVQLDQGTDDQDHLISPEERLRVAMARQ